MYLLRAESQKPAPPQAQGHGGLALLGAPCKAITGPGPRGRGGLKAGAQGWRSLSPHPVLHQVRLDRTAELSASPSPATDVTPVPRGVSGPRPHPRDKHSSRRSPCLLWNYRKSQRH